MKKIIALVVVAACGLAIYGASKTSMLDAGLASVKALKNMKESVSAPKNEKQEPKTAEGKPAAAAESSSGTAAAKPADAGGKNEDSSPTAGVIFPKEQDTTPFSKISADGKAYAEIGQTKDPEEPAGERFVKERAKGR